jgi:hypothetical protein
MIQGDLATAYANAHVSSFMYLNKEEPGKWSLAQGESSFLFNNGFIDHDRGCLVSLYKSIPVPDKDVPLQDILNFKEKHADEIQSLRNELVELYQKIQNSEDEEFIKRHYENKIIKDCSDLIKTMKEKKLPFRFSDIQISLNIPIGATVGYLAGQQWNVSALTFGICGSLKGSNQSDTPYRYVSSYHQDLFCGPDYA